MSGGTAPTPMIWGARKAAIKALLWARILWLAIRTCGGPWTALSTVRAMVAERARVRRWTTTKYATVGGRYFWNLYSPGWPSKAFDLYVEHELDRVRPSRSGPPALQSAIFAITKSCPLECEHCCEWDALNEIEALSSEDLQTIVERLRHRGVTHLFLSGGEPLRRFDDVVRIVKGASVDTDVWVLTSGVGLTLERAEGLASAGLTGVALSLDHWDPAEHDRFRGVRGAAEWVERASEHARRSGLLVALSICPTRAFVTPENLVRYVQTARRLGASFVQLLEPKSVGRYGGQDVRLTPAQQRMLEDMCTRLNTSSECLELPSVSYPDYSRRSSRCYGAGDRYLYVDTDGMVHPCPFCRCPSGTALEGDFDQTLARMRQGGCRAEIAEGAHHG